MTFTQNPAIKRGWLRALSILVPFFIVTILFQFIGVLTNSTVFSKSESIYNQIINTSTIEMTIVQFWSTIGTVLCVWFFTHSIDDLKLKDIGLSLKKKGKDILLGLFLGVLLISLGSIILYFNGNLEITTVQFSFSEFLSSMLLFIFVAFNEEIIMRGYILRNFMDSMNKYLALIASAMIFMLFHAFNPNTSALGLFNIAIAGLLLGISYIYTKNLWFPIAFHFSWNFFQGPIMGYEVSGSTSKGILIQKLSGSDFLTGGKFGFEGSFLASIICLLTTLIIAWYYKNKCSF